MINYKEFALSVANTYSLELDTKKVLAFFENELKEDFEGLNTEAVKKDRYSYFQIEGSKPEDYSENYTEINELKVIHGIRHFGGDKNLPFVNIIASKPILSKKDALSVYDSIKERYKFFKPLHLSFRSAKEIDADFFASIHMVQKAQVIKSIKPWQFESEIKFVTINDRTFYDWYKNQYEVFHKNFPELKEKVTLNELDVFEDGLKESLLQFVKISDEIVGLIAAERSKFLGEEGIYFNDIVITKDWKGKGLAKAIQRKFVEKFSSDEWIWGTIDKNNLPSYNTALANRRMPVSYECFIKLS